MVDIHCHILPLVDDGPASVEHALQLAEQAVAEGCRGSSRHHTSIIHNSKQKMSMSS